MSKLRNDGKTGWIEPEYRTDDADDTIEIVLAEDDAEAMDKE